MKDESNAAREIEPSTNDYGGPERRRHRVYLTRNTEYHLRDGFCVAVRDRRTGDFLQGHLALQRRVHGGLKFFPDGGIAPNAGEPRRPHDVTKTVVASLNAETRPAEAGPERPAPRDDSL